MFLCCHDAAAHRAALRSLRFDNERPEAGAPVLRADEPKKQRWNRTGDGFGMVVRNHSFAVIQPKTELTECAES